MACCTAGWCDHRRWGPPLAHVDEQSVRDIPGLMKVVVRKDFVGVVAQTQYQAVVAARQLIVRWNAGPSLPAQRPSSNICNSNRPTKFSTWTPGTLRRDWPRQAAWCGQGISYPYQMHGSVGASCAVADVRPDGATVWSSAQSAYPTRSIVAELLGLPVDACA